MGEKFSANPVTGTGSFTVPVASTPGRSGFGPELMLAYDSGQGNGPLGLGWSLRLPAVTRRTDKVLPVYRDDIESDVFVLSGVEDLVPQLDGAAGWERLTLDEPPYAPGFRVDRYRPRVEGAFARIERWTAKADGQVQWRSVSRDNVTTVYGADPSSRIADPSDVSRVFSWLICRRYDDRGNVVVYEYKAEDGAGIDPGMTHEVGRTAAGRSANRYLKRVRYGNRTSMLADPELASPDWAFEVVLDYGEHDALAPTPAEQGGWLCRNDPFSHYRQGFEVRTYRLCQRLLMFHHFPAEPDVGADCLVRSTDLAYASLRGQPGDMRCGGPVVSLLASVTHSGYRRKDAGYLRRSMPAVEFEYSPAGFWDQVSDVDPGSVANLPAGMAGAATQWADIDGEGISGVLAEQGGAWLYKRNIGEGRFAPVEALPSLPSPRTLGTSQRQLLDVAGDGRLALVDLGEPAPGFFARTDTATWTPYTPFTAVPRVRWEDPNLRLVDLDGDGRADVLITEVEALTWYPSLAQAGFGPGERVVAPADERDGPRLVFADPTGSVYLADMSGDGLSDLVRIRNGDVCYWPNLGFGRFGPRVSMDDAPWFDHPDRFDHRFLKVADVDGSGTADLVYLDGATARIWLNQSGNSFAEQVVLTGLPAVDSLSIVSVTDLLGQGTPCLVWSSPLPPDASRPMRYVDLTGGVKPYLLTSMSNNLGARTRVGYTSSTRFYLADRAAGRPWVTRLPFPVHVVDQVEVSDLVSGNRFTTRYAYHHGYFDPVEREFRGFGMVEQQDTEEITALGDAANADPAHALPPVLTRSWFHTGAPGPPGGVSRQFEPEYYREVGLTDAQAESMLLPDTALPDTLLLASGGRVPYQPVPQEDREAARALKGSVLRQELYAIDGGDRQDLPYQITETAYSIEQLQPLRADRHAVYAVHPSETLTLHCERVLPADPRVTHEITLEVNAYLDVLRSVSLAYSRRRPDPAPDLDPATRDALHAAQNAVLPTLIERTYTSPVTDGAAHRGPYPADCRTFELINIRPAGTDPDVTPLFGVAELRALVDAASDGAHDLPCEDVDHLGATTPAPFRRLVGQRRVLYRRDDLTGPLPLGELQSGALPFQQYTLAFTPGLTASAGLDPLLIDPAGVLGAEGGYLSGDTATATGLFPPGDPMGWWWIPSGQVGYSPGPADTAAQELAHATAHFFLPNRFSDPFGNTTVVTYDRYDLFAAQSSDPLGNTVTAGTRAADGTVAADGRDYRVVRPRLFADANRNRSAVAYDALGMVVATAVMGKPERLEGDSLDGLEPDLDNTVVAAHLADPLTDPSSILGNATTRLVYDLFASQRTTADPRPQPACAYTLARETHAADLTAGAQPRVQHSFAYTDGFGRTIQHKAQAEPGPVADGGPAVSPRWVGSGWTVYDNKGHPVRQYEPFFTATHRFEFGLAAGVSPVLCYDPVGRLIATLLPNDAFQKVVFDPWRQVSFDLNDTVLLDPRTDTDVAAYLSGYLDTRPGFQTWYAQRQAGGLGVAEQDAAAKTAAHADTPTVAYADSLGRSVLTVAHNRLVRPGAPAAESAYRTRVVLDILGNQRAVSDPLGRTAQSSVFDAASRVLLQRSADAGDTRTVPDVAGKPIRISDSRGRTTRITYDPLRRPLRTYVRTGSAAEVLRERTVYGEVHPDAAALNLRTRVHQHYDDSGVVLGNAHDFKGNPLRTTRRLAAQYRDQSDWIALDGQTDAQLVAALPESLLTSDAFLTSSAYDALNRPASVTSPDGSVYRPTYNEANLLETVDVALAGETRNGRPVWTPFVTDLDYNAKGQRTLLACANGTRTDYAHDSLTFRLTGIRTTRSSGTSGDCQNLSYTYNPVGNITQLADAAQQTVFFNNAVVTPGADYTYDAVYRLVTAQGREHIGQATAPQPTWDDAARTRLPQPGDGQAMRRYTQIYDYNPVGNLGRLAHRATAGNWTRTFLYAEPSPLGTGETSNRLSSSTIGGITEAFTYDAHGNLTSMPHLPIVGWDDRDRLHSADRGGGATVYCTYDAAGQRVRKIVERQNGTRQYERVYLGNVEIYREYDGTGDTVTLERRTVHVMDDQRRVALVETRTTGTDPAPAKLVRYQYDNHLGSACLELDDTAAIISYEEYHPYGTTSYQAVRSQTETPKRYRYTGKERDEETGFTYHGARCYAPWLCRWTCPDPTARAADANRYEYVGSRPTRMTDPNGRWGVDMHFVAVYWTGRLEGASHLDALHAALASQSLDDYLQTSAPAMKTQGLFEKIRDFFGGDDLGSRITTGANYSHALNVTKKESLYLAEQGARAKSPILMGLGMHAEGDYLPHANLTGRDTMGHEQGRNKDLSPSSWLSGSADETMRNPMKALATFQQLRSTWDQYPEKPNAPRAVDLQALSHFIYAENASQEKELAWRQGLAAAGVTEGEINIIAEFAAREDSKDKRKEEWAIQSKTAEGRQAIAGADRVWYVVLPGRRANSATVNNMKVDISSEFLGLPNIGKPPQSFLDRQRFYEQSIQRIKTAPDRGGWF